MERMSKEAENRILDAVQSVTAAVSEGSDPTDAVVKIAQELQLPIGHARVLANAYNVAESTYVRQQGNSVLEKAAVFAMADPEEIVRRLTPEIKTAAAREYETLVSAEYSRSPSWLDTPTMTKSAELHIPLQPRPAATGMTVKQAQQRIRNREQNIELLRRHASGYKTALAHGLDDLAVWFAGAHPAAYATAVKMAEARMPGAPVLLLKRVAASHPHFAKAAALPEWQQFDAKREPYRTLQKLADTAHSAIAADEAVKLAMETHVILTDEEMIPLTGKAPLTHGLIDPLEKVANIIPFMGANMARDVVGSIARGIAPPDKDKLVQKQMQAIGSPEHEQKMQDISTQSMLHDLLANDEVVSGYDPFEVTNAYNNLSQIAPRTAQHPLAVQAMLRKQLSQGSLDPFEVEQAIKMEGQLSKLNGGSGGSDFAA
jgi:hypothetical protein